MNKSILDFYMPIPATLGEVYNRKPPMNGGGSPTPPPSPPPSPAPFRSDSEDGSQALTISKRRKGLRKTILAGQIANEMKNESLGVSNNLNSVNANTNNNNTILGGAM